MTLCQRLAVCLIASLATGIASAQVAYVYISVDNNNTSYQVYGYRVSPNGKLTPMKNSPFTTPGSMVGSNGTHFITLGTEYVYSNRVLANGGIGEQVSEINTQSFTGAACGDDTAGDRTYPMAGLDHTGHNVYVPLYLINEQQCDAIQTFKVTKTGSLSFNGATIYAQGGPTIAGAASVPTLLGDNKFAFNSLVVPGNCDGGVRAFSRESSGMLNNINFTETDPEPDPTKYVGYLTLSFIAADAANHLAILVEPTTIADPKTKCFGASGTFQLASYTVDGQGNLTSTNTYEDMPSFPNYLNDLKIDPTGKFLAVALATGVQVYHFDGGKPIEPLTGVIGTSGSISQLAWDQDGRLYAQEGASGAMHVYTVNWGKVEEAPDSPTTVAIGQLFTVRSR